MDPGASYGACHLGSRNYLYEPRSGQHPLDIVMGISSLLLVQAFRSRGIIVPAAAKTSEYVRPGNRLKIYLAAIAVTAISATEQARSVTFRHRLKLPQELSFSGTSRPSVFWLLSSNFWSGGGIPPVVGIPELYSRLSRRDDDGLLYLRSRLGHLQTIPFPNGL